MKNLKYFTYFFGLFLLSSSSCKAQNPKLIELSDVNQLNYYLANIWKGPILQKEIYSNGFYIKVFEMEDSKATPKDLFEGYDGVLSSLLVSVMPDGDYYTKSRLYKIQSMLNPTNIEINETSYPKFSIKIEFVDIESKSHTVTYELTCD